MFILKVDGKTIFVSRRSCYRVQQMGPGGEGDQAPYHGRGQVPHEERHDVRG